MLRHLPLICICMLICRALNAQPDLKKEYELIDSAWKKKDYNTVIDKATGIILKNRKEENAWIYWTYAHANLNKYQEAYDGYRELVTLDPESFDYHTGAGWYGVGLRNSFWHSDPGWFCSQYGNCFPCWWSRLLYRHQLEGFG